MSCDVVASEIEFLQLLWTETEEYNRSINEHYMLLTENNTDNAGNSCKTESVEM